MSIWDGLIQGIIQGLTEFLPVSSSGHLLLYQHFTGNSGAGSQLFSLMLHVGTLVAVVAFYFDDVRVLVFELGYTIRDIFTRRFTVRTQDPNRKLLYMLVVATLPLLLVVPINGWLERIAENDDIVFEGFCFLLTALLLFAASKVRPGRAGIRQMGGKQALIIGVAQDIAVLPGVSRSGATIATGMVLGFDADFMAKFSFLMSIPTILGGMVVKLGSLGDDAVKVPLMVLIVGVVAAAVFGFLSITLIRWLLRERKFIYFAWYTGVLGIIVIVVGLIEHIAGKKVPDASSLSQLSDISSQIVSAVAGL